MRWLHPPSGRRLRLGYCMNLHPADTVDGVLERLQAVTLPLKERLQPTGPFGVGLYLPSRLAETLARDLARDGTGRDLARDGTGRDLARDGTGRELARDGTGRELARDAREGRALGSRAGDFRRLADFLGDHDLDPFTFNAFPAQGFARPGLKERVFEPTWLDDARLAFTRDVADVAAALVRGRERHVSISTHPGLHASRPTSPADRERCADNLARACGYLAELEERGSVPIVLSLEAEPRASANDTSELADFLALVRERGAPLLAREGALDPERTLRRHLGVCLDACHAAVEFEDTRAALANATRSGTPLGKLQFSSALALPDPDGDALGRASLLALDEPCYLHQVTGVRDGELVRAGDLGEVARALARGDPAWTGCAEWRCHFHVPVDLGGEIDRVHSGGLATTRAWADVALARLLADPARWGTEELHLEIETYTWDVLPVEARGAGDLVDGLEREYLHVCRRLEAAGWSAG